MKSLPSVLFYCAIQGVFLPLVLWVDELRSRGSPSFWVVFGLYEALVVGDALLYWVIFSKEKN